LTSDGTITDVGSLSHFFPDHLMLTRCGKILYSFPLPVDKIADLVDLQTHVEKITVMIDHELQVNALAKYAAAHVEGKAVRFNAFIKIDQGGA
jgi:D-serine deaminase-like pyridoxal phosphate-dependent protein